MDDIVKIALDAIPDVHPGKEAIKQRLQLTLAVSRNAGAVAALSSVMDGIDKMEKAEYAIFSFKSVREYVEQFRLRIKRETENLTGRPLR